ncbi:NAD-dependent epimerase/dehydratase family protein, partial [Staphylococcus pettenkoferi]|uniref:NAD-dependent epimerase/dehydratase family protein n=1 Tax=Staphylococcus pettenkoferi TaxID=170573 RepID=UPI0011A62D23
PVQYVNNDHYALGLILQVMKDHHLNHILFSSTPPLYPQPHTLPIHHTHTQPPTNPYRQTKFIIHKIIKSSHQPYPVNYT